MEGVLLGAGVAAVLVGRGALVESRSPPAREAGPEDSSSLDWQVNRSPKAGQRQRLGQGEGACA